MFFFSNLRDVPPSSSPQDVKEVQDHGDCFEHLLAPGPAAADVLEPTTGGSAGRGGRTSCDVGTGWTWVMLGTWLREGSRTHNQNSVFGILRHTSYLAACFAKSMFLIVFDNE